MSPSRSILRSVGSLWFAAVLLVLWLVAMACATVVESSGGAERALVEFYESWWFRLLLGLLAVNVAAAVLLRYPFSKRQIGFVITHAGILVTLGGALVTWHWGIYGRVGLAEGQTSEQFTVQQDTLTIVGQGDKTGSTVDLTGRAFGGLVAVDRPSAPALSVGNLRVEIEKYLPDSMWSMRVTDDNPDPQPAVQVSFSATGREAPTWLLADEPPDPGGLQACFRIVADEAELQWLLEAASKGTVQVEYHGLQFEFPMEEGLEQAVPLGDTGYTARVLRYLPHAKVQNEQLVSVSDRPVNPAIEVEFVGPGGTEKRWAFAQFPEFGSIQDGGPIEGLEVAFEAGEETSPRAPIEVIAVPGGGLWARFRRGSEETAARELTVGQPVETPWPGRKFAVLRRYERARFRWSLTPTEEIGEARIPAILVKLATPEHSQEVWVQKFHPREVTVAGAEYELTYANKSVPLGFTLKLNEFRIEHYPGTRRPRSFESHVTITDRNTGRQQDRVISMNNPTSHAGYTLFQSGRDVSGGRRVSYLSVSRDPGQAIVFTGYVATMVGMVVVLITRLLDWRRAARREDRAKDAAAPQQGQQYAEPGLDLSLERVASGSTGSPRRPADAVSRNQQ